MDGAYIPDGNVTEDTSLDKVQYGPTEIRTASRAKILSRNHQKRQNLNRICGQPEIWGIPYRVYFMSCNLDHVLYDKPNSTDEEKENNSYAFAKKYKDDPVSFVEYIQKSDFSVVNGYARSWDFIKQGLHSLGRYTNLGLCFIPQAAESEHP